MTKVVVNKQHTQSTLDSVLTRIGIYDEFLTELAPHILPNAKFQVWDVGDKGLEENISMTVMAAAHLNLLSLTEDAE